MRFLLALMFGAIIALVAMKVFGADGVSQDAIVTGELALVLLGILRIAEIAHKLIPDHATGVAGALRKLAAIVGLYVKNRG